MRAEMEFQGYIQRIAGMLMACLIFTSPLLIAQTLDSLQQQGRLSIETRIVPVDNIIAMQQLELQIEVATDRWFSGGTRIGHFEISDAIVLQREKFAVNSTRVEGGVTWTIQTWSVTIFPQRAGHFRIPAIPLTITVSDEDLQQITGQLSTEPMDFSAIVPEPLQGKPNWVASPVFSVKESFDRKLENFKPGDALIRTVKFSAEDTPAMMLPTLTSLELEGMSVYSKPPVLSDKANRGDYLSERTEVLTYVFEKPGDYQLPEEVFYWWNLQKQALQEIVLPAQMLQVGPGKGTGDVLSEDMSTDAEVTGSKADMAKFVLLALGLILLLYILIKRVVRSGRAIPAKLSEADLQKKFKAACAQENPELAIALLYQYLDHFGGAEFDGEIRPLLQVIDEGQKNQFDALMRAVFSEHAQQQADICLFAKQFRKRLRQHKYHSWLPPLEFKLN